MDEELEFKPFHETYRLITFSLCIAMIYPNPRTEKWRLFSIPILIATVAPVAIMIFLDMYKCWKNGDIVNIIRHSTVVGPFLGGFFKMILMYHKRVQAKQILDEFDRDHLMFNTVAETYKDIARASIRNCQIYSERLWACLVTTCVMTFPIMAIVLNIYNFMFKSEPTKYMIHDLEKPFSKEPEERFESPYFELLFVYMFYAAILYVVNFTGYDGFFGLCVNHACLKMELYCKALEEAMMADREEVYGRVIAVIREQCRMFRCTHYCFTLIARWDGNPTPPERDQAQDRHLHVQFSEGATFRIPKKGKNERTTKGSGFFGLCVNHACLKMELYCKALEEAMMADREEVYGRVIAVIREQCRMFRYVDLIQDTFNIWLGIIFIATMIQICTCLYHITEGYGFDIRYMIFVYGAVVHIYLPCRYAAKLKAMSMETSNRFYCSGWERVDDERVRKMIVFMIARAQVPNEITAFNMMAFDMELFLSILQTSYSMFTLLRS